MELNELKKDLYKSKANAELKYYHPSTGDLTYMFNAMGKNWEFPIHTHIKQLKTIPFGDVDVALTLDYYHLVPNPDIQGAKFEPVMRASDLIRWIAQAMEFNELIELNEAE